MNSTSTTSQKPRQDVGAVVPERLPRPDAARLVPAVLGAYAFVGGLLVLIGWFANIPLLADWNSGIAMMPNAAVCAMGAGAALMLRAVLWRRGLAALLGAFVGLIGAATLFEHLSGINLGIDTVLILPKWGQLGTVAPGRMGLPASTSWMIVGASLVLMCGGPRGRGAAATGGLLVVAIAVLSLVGYLFGADLLFTLPRVTAIALQTATIILAVGIGIIATLPDREPMKTLCAATTTGLLARRALPWITMLPLGVGLLRLRGQEAGLFDTAFGTALVTLVELVLLLTLLGWALAKVAAKETALRQEQERVSETLESIADGLHVIDAEGRFTYFNAAGRKMMVAQGLDPAALLGRPIFEQFPEARETEVGRAIQATLSGQAVTEGETFYTPWQLWFTARNYPTPEGGVATYFRDITEHRRSAARVAEELEAMRRLHDVGRRCAEADGDYDTCLASLVETAVALTGAEKGSIQLLNEATGMLEIAAHRGFEEPFLKFFGRVQAGDVSVCGSALRSEGRVIVEDVTKHEIFAGQPVLHVFLAAGVRAVQSTPLVSGAGKVIGMMSTHCAAPRRFSERQLRLLDLLARQATDYIERKRAEEKLRDAQAQVQAALLGGAVGTWNWDLKTNLLISNPSLLRMFGLPTDHAHRGEPPESYIAAIFPEDQPTVVQAIKRALADGSDGLYEVEYRVRNAAGEVRWVIARGRVEYDSAHKPSRFSGALTDITERKRGEAALRQAHEELRRHAEELEHFNRLMVGREARMIELKKEVNVARKAHGLAPLYPLEFEPGGNGKETP